MNQKVIDLHNAAQIIGVKYSLLFEWCKNGIIKCLDAPDEYSDRSKYVIDERECDYLSRLVSKYGARNALLNYNKDYIPSSNPPLQELNPSNCETLQENFFSYVGEQEYFSSQVDENKNSSSSVKAEKTVKDNSYAKVSDDTDSLVENIWQAHNLKQKISYYEEKLINTRKEYERVKEIILNSDIFREDEDACKQS